MTALPHLSRHADLGPLLDQLPAAGQSAMTKAAAREPRLTKPMGALGRLEHLTEWLAGWQRRYPPRLDQIGAVVFVGNHGVAARGVSAYPTAVTAQMVENFRRGGAAINQLVKSFGIELTVRALDLDRPTADFTAAPALEEAEFLAAFTAGLEEGARSRDLLCLGEMGIGNTTAAAAIAHALFHGSARAWTGVGTGVVGASYLEKVAVVELAVSRHLPLASDALDLLRRLGGRELAAIAGAVVGARLVGVPVILDGYVCTAAAAPLAVMRPDALDHCLIAHASSEPGHRLLARRLGKRPLLDLDLRLGEASGSVLAVPLLRAALACHMGMATFDEAGVEGRGDES